MCFTDARFWGVIVLSTILAIPTSSTESSHSPGVVSVILPNSGAEVLGREILVNGGVDVAWRFRGVPYAKPPLGELRFQPPEPLDPPEDGKPIDASTDQPRACHGMVMDRRFGMTDELELGANRQAVADSMSEDCLYLNVWTTPLNKTAPLRPVLVQIHGGGFFAGAADYSAYDGAVLTTRADVVVVVPNYRFGVFGFLTLGTDDMPGNAGLWDVVVSLKWIRDNIQAFGGDPSRVTLLGESAGGTVVDALLESPRARPLFARAIISSGVAKHNVYGIAAQEEIVRNSIMFLRSLRFKTRRNHEGALEKDLDDESRVDEKEEEIEVDEDIEDLEEDVAEDKDEDKQPDDSAGDDLEEKSKDDPENKVPIFDEGSSDKSKLRAFILRQLFLAKKLKATVLDKIQWIRLTQYPGSLYPFRPMVDERVLMEDSYLAPGADGNVDVDVILGWNDQEFANYAITSLLADVGLNAKDKDAVLWNVTRVAEYWKNHVNESSNLNLKEFNGTARFETVYRLSENSSIVSQFYTAIKRETDSWFVCPMIARARRLSEVPGVNVYAYEMRHNLEALPDWMGAHHGMQLPLVFGRMLDPDRMYRTAGTSTSPPGAIPFSDTDVSVSVDFIKELASFVRDGRPTLTWPQFTAGDERVRIFGQRRSEEEFDLNEKDESKGDEKWERLSPWQRQRCDFVGDSYLEESTQGSAIKSSLSWPLLVFSTIAIMLTMTMMISKIISRP